MTLTLPIVLAIVLQNALLAAVLALLARCAGPRFAPAVHAAMLVLAGLIYVRYAFLAGDGRGLVVEGVGTLALLALAGAGLRRRSSGWLATGWLLHPLWDVALHTGGVGGYAPIGYVIACVAFDPTLAFMIWKGWAGLPPSVRTRPAAAVRSA